MNGWPEDPVAEPSDDLAKLLAQLEAAQEAHVELGAMPLEELGFLSTGAMQTAPPAPPDIDRYLDPLARQLGALEDYQEGLNSLPPPPKLEAPKPYKPEVQAYGAFLTKPSLTPDGGVSGAGRNWAGPRLGPHPVGRSAGVRASFGCDSPDGSFQSEVWCFRLEDVVRARHAGCSACDRPCPLALATSREDEDSEEEE